MPAKTRISGWSSAPTSFELEGDAAHVWLVTMDDADGAVENYGGILSSEERERAARFKFERDRTRYTIAHAVLRLILAAYSKVNPFDLRFLLGTNGKPRLESDRLAFNLSHSHEVALIGVTRSGEIGVDVEWVNPEFVFDEVAQRFFTPREVAALTALPRHLQRQGFYKCWTSKEAYLKAKGTGLSGELVEVTIFLDQNEVVHIQGDMPGWSFIEIGPIEGYEAVAVVSGKDLKLKGYLWNS